MFYRLCTGAVLLGLSFASAQASNCLPGLAPGSGEQPDTRIEIVIAKGRPASFIFYSGPEIKNPASPLPLERLYQMDINGPLTVPEGRKDLEGYYDPVNRVGAILSTAGL